PVYLFLRKFSLQDSRGGSRKDMNSSFLTKYLSKLTLTINIILTVITWFYLIGTDNPIWYSIIQSYAFISFDTAKIIITVICIVWIVRSITDYELKTVLFTQADIQKEILKELRALRNSKEMHNADTAGDNFRIDFDKVDY
ncbi:hypothetical protein Q0T58_06900, partial [Escherichia coli O18:H14]